jgi:uncharacterized integral membrane protein (TIGR00697 family)
MRKRYKVNKPTKERMMGTKLKRSTIWAIVILVGGYILAQAVADVGATKFIILGPVVLPAGSWMFAFTFTLRDLIHKRLGKEWARAVIFAAAGFNVIQAIYLQSMARLPYPDFFANGEAWSAIFLLVPSITIASITAEVVSELIDTEIYHLTIKRFTGIWQFMRVVISNGVSLPIDSFIFAMLAFVVLPPLFGAESIPFRAAWGLVVGQITWKVIITLISMPGIYFVKEKPLEGI